MSKRGSLRFAEGLRAVRPNRRFGKLAAVTFVVAAGLVALEIGSAILVLSNHREDLNRRSEQELQQLLDIVADGMRQPVWDLSPQAGTAIVESLENDPRFVGVEVTSLAQGLFLSYIRSGDIPRVVLERVAPVVFEGRKIGEVRARIDPGKLVATIDDRWVYTVVLFTLQFLFSVGAVLLLIRLAMRHAREVALAGANRQLQTEIEERKRFSEALQTSEQHLRDIVNALPMSVLYVDRELYLRAANRVCQQWWNRSEAELVGHHFSEFYSSERAAYFEQNIGHTFAGNTWQFDAELTYPDGKTREIESLHVPDFDDQSLVRGAFIIAQDVTQRNHTDRELASFRRLMQETIDAAPISISIKDHLHRYVFANRAAEEKLGVTRDEMIGHTMREANVRGYSLEFVLSMAVADNEVFDTGNEMPFTSIDSIEDGEMCHQFLSKTPIKDEAGRVTHIVTVSLDVTDLKRAEAAAIAAKDEAELANTAKSEFLANMSHELRTPLNAIIGFSELMLNETFGAVGNPKYADYLKDIHQSGEHLHSIITDLLDVSRIDVGQVSLDLAPVNLGAVLDSAITMLRSKADQAGVALIDRCDRPFPPLQGDLVRLRQIFINLIDNAIKFTDPGGEVSVSTTFAEPGRLSITVADTGIGIEEADVARVVEPFVHLQSMATRNVSGTGLGLSLAKALAEMHGGNLAIKSQVGTGTAVTIELPCDPHSSDEFERQRSA